MTRIACIGECMIEISGASPGASQGSGHGPFGPCTLGYAGDTLNAAIYMARTARLLGNAPLDIAYVTALGDDSYSDAMIAGWQRDGLHTGLVRRLPGQLPGLYAIQTDTHGERSFHYWRNNAAARNLITNGGDAVLRDGLAQCDLVYLSGISLAILPAADRDTLFGILQDVKSAGGRIGFDSNHRPRLWNDADSARACYQKFAALCDNVLPTFDDEHVLFGDPTPQDTARRWQDWGASEIIVKNGGDATLYLDSSGATGTLTPPKVPHIVDTTSAGDSFNGSFLAARQSGHRIDDAIMIAQKVAGRVITRHGALVDISDLDLAV
ncbi:sugar kinase [Thalassospira sp.]|uniref:sugar kinase n=1 Tax=Thalassospira sp. TaxID=1912094 RepID=UPI002732E182|nr:sugar kinase [Thalassospira sp.]MDP2697685.1 sugar kinase [Thalassospira sp.]